MRSLLLLITKNVNEEKHAKAGIKEKTEEALETSKVEMELEGCQTLGPPKRSFWNPRKPGELRNHYEECGNLAEKYVQIHDAYYRPGESQEKLNAKYGRENGHLLWMRADAIREKREQLQKFMSETQLARAPMLKIQD